MKRDIKTPVLIRAVKGDIFRCMCGDLASHARVNIILTELTKKLNWLENRSGFNSSLRR